MIKVQCFLLVFATLLTCLIGCAKQHQGLAGGIVFEVDGVEYWIYRHADVDRQGRVASSILLVSFRSEQVGGSTQYASYRGTTEVSLYLDGEKIIATPNTLYFIQNKQTVFQKRYKELGIDARQLNADLAVMSEYLQPILEQLIREHVKSQEPEVEEQQ